VIHGPGAGANERISLRGVPWMMPQNARFKLKDLPTSLDKLEYDFVWMDLLTKPQEELSEAMIERKKRQILVARQVGIFRLAGTAIAW